MRFSRYGPEPIRNRKVRPLINDRGELVGYGYGAGVADRAFVWRNGKIVDLGRCGGYSTAADINARGGNGKLKKLPSFDRDQPATFATALKSRRMTALPTLGGGTGAPFTTVATLNDRGQIVGSSELRLVMWTRRTANPCRISHCRRWPRQAPLPARP